jgi:hypothetical protein
VLRVRAGRPAGHASARTACSWPPPPRTSASRSSPTTPRSWTTGTPCGRPR